MMQILVVGDGPRDQSALPNLICRLLGTEVETRYDDWHQVRHLRGKGDKHARKLKYLSRRAQSDGFHAMAVVVDADKSPPREKLRVLRGGRDEDRQIAPPFPTAIGEAVPHFDVWLLDEPVAVRQGLGLGNDLEVPNVLKVSYPKDALTALVSNGSVTFDHISDALGAIAKEFELHRCRHRNETGMAAFVEDVEAEIRPVLR